MAARIALPAAVVIVVLLATMAVAPSPAPAQEVANDTTTIAFDLQANGDARVSITLRLGLQDDAERAAFDDLATEHASGGESPLVVDSFERAASLAGQEAGRQMEVQDVSKTADRSSDTGELVLSFTWTNFTRVSNGQLLLGDVFQRPGGTWLPGIEPGQELRISFPDRYSTQDISIPGARFQVVNGTIRVEGPASFEPGTPSVVLEQPGDNTGTPPSGIPTSTALGVLLVAVLAATAVGAYWFRDRLPELRRGLEWGEDAAAGDDEPVDPMSEPLLSDEERVLKLLEARDGRMKQVEIVEATDWSNAKVSQLLSEMEEAGRVDKLRIGRENLISLPGRGPGSQ